MFPLAEYRKILILRLGSLGDVVHTIPAQQLLNELHPEAEIHWVVEPPYAGLLGCVEGIHRTWIADTKRWRQGWQHLGSAFDLNKSLRAERFDLAVDFQGLIKSAVLARLSGARRVIGFSGARLRERPAGWWYHERVRIEAGQRHQVAYNLDLVQPPRYGPVFSGRIKIDLPEEDAALVQERLRTFGVEQPVLLNPGGGWETKRWACDRFAGLADWIESELQIPVIFTYGPGEEGLLAEIESHMTGKMRSFPTTILQLAALCRESRLMVAGDTGPLHLAVAMGTAVAAILGPAHVWRTGPCNPDDVVVTHSTPCPRPYKRVCADHFCMDIPLEEVCKAVHRRLTRKGYAVDQLGCRNDGWGHP